MSKGEVVSYGSDAKTEYRRRVWTALIGLGARDLPKDQYVLCLPNTGTSEMDLLVEMGVPEDRIIGIDQNPAIIAASKWRKKYPRAKWYAKKLSDAVPLIREDGYKVFAANLDFCGGLADPMIREVSSTIARHDECDGIAERIAITMSKGREPSALVHMLDHTAVQFHNVNDARMKALLACAHGVTETSWLDCALVLDQGSYINNKQPMTWIALWNDYRGLPDKMVNKIGRSLMAMLTGRWLLHKSAWPKIHHWRTRVPNQRRWMSSMLYDFLERWDDYAPNGFGNRFCDAEKRDLNHLPESEEDEGRYLNFDLAMGVWKRRVTDVIYRRLLKRAVPGADLRRDEVKCAFSALMERIKTDRAEGIRNTFDDVAVMDFDSDWLISHGWHEGIAYDRAYGKAYIENCGMTEDERNEMVRSHLAILGQSLKDVGYVPSA